MARKLIASKKEVSDARKTCGCMKAEENFAIAAAMLVLLTTMIQPVYSAGLAIILLVCFAIYKRMMADGTWPCKACKK